MADERSTRASGIKGQNMNNEPTNGTGTIRENSEKYRSDDVAEIKKRQETTAQRNKEIANRRKMAIIEARKGKRVKVVVRLAIAVFVIALCVVAFLLTFKLFYDTPLDPENKTKTEITVKEGITDEEVADLLYEAGCIEDKKLYKFRTYIYDAKYVPGTYKVSPSYTTEKIINILSGYDYSDGTMEE
ncbi:MAG: hypothetical protein MJ092_04340 [Lachnospiraceae bacterium]|nr:hypothetical protein [Lachnospiraceae bacterium]